MDDSDEGVPFKKLRVPKFHTDYGMKIEAKTFYESPRKEEDEPLTWVESVPSVLPTAARRRFDSAAIQIFKRIEGEKTFNNVPTYTTSFIVIQSPYILDVLRGLITDLNVVIGEKSFKISPPFEPLYHSWDEILAAHSNASAGVDQKEYLHLGVLVRFMKEELGETFSRIHALRKEGRMAHELLWSLYPTGSIIFSSRSGYQQAYRVLSCYSTASYADNRQNPDKKDWIVQCEFVQFDGYEYGYSEIAFRIPVFQNPKSITSLDVYPWAFVEDSDMRNNLISRGRRVLDFQGCHYQNYEGIATEPPAVEVVRGKAPLSPDEETPTWFRTKFNVIGRIIVDPYLYARMNEYLRRQIRPLRRRAKSSKPKATNSSYALPPSHTERRPFVDGEGSPEDKPARALDLGRPNAENHERNRQEVEQDEEHLLLMSPFLDGFSLGEKKWMNFLIEHVKPLSLHGVAFQNLVLPEEQKDLILSFAEQQDGIIHELQDVISGKGQGLLVLLSGPPGTGKTLTAEAVADKVGRPLYHVDTHEIGSEVQKLSLNLRKIMNMAAEWNAIVLLDEADVFLQQRKPENISRNETVAVFLRELEYYRGTLFLTTNMIDHIDEAIESRVHVHIIFQRLQASAREKIWKSMLRQVPQYSANLSEADYKELGTWTLNGRQIKNTAQMAAKWSARVKQPLTLDSVEEVIRLTCPRSTRSDEGFVDVNGKIDPVS